MKSTGVRTDLHCRKNGSARRKVARRRKSPEVVLCSILNSLSREHKLAIARHMR